VESMHYESRKNILEYDDVANHQRKAIYKFRNQLLDPEFDISKKINENRVEYVDHLLGESEIIAGMPQEDFNIHKLRDLIIENLNLDIPITEFENKDIDELQEFIVEALTNIYEDKMSQFDAQTRHDIESEIYLSVLDPEWREHLYEMDVLKTGIGLRGYNQKDPLTEYKQDSYHLFSALIARIKHEAVKKLQIVQFKFENEDEIQEQLEQMKDELEIEMDKVVESGAEQTTQPQVGGKKPKRNEPCPCGSGKKYKQCCGKSGPKKGLLA